MIFLCSGKWAIRVFSGLHGQWFTIFPEKFWKTHWLRRHGKTSYSNFSHVATFVSSRFVKINQNYERVLTLYWSGCTNGMNALYEVFITQDVPDLGWDARHDAHAQYNVVEVRQLHADFGQRGANGVPCCKGWRTWHDPSCSPGSGRSAPCRAPQGWSIARGFPSPRPSRAVPCHTFSQCR